MKIPLDGGFTCPNRDGTLSKKGCIFCSKKGSGEFAGNKSLTIKEQFESVKNKTKKKYSIAKYIAYFQAYTNTYAPIDVLHKKYYEALKLPDIVGISIATRPDCLNNEVMSLLQELSKKTYLFVELGLQTSKESTAKLINRCYKNEIFEEGVKKLKNININVVCHCILGLPYENKKDMLNTIKFACSKNIDGIKLQLLYILKDTQLEKLYYNKKFRLLKYDEYIDIVVSCLEIIPQNIVIHRLTGDPPRNDLIAPLFSLKKFHILNDIDKELTLRNSIQGKNLNKF